MEHEGIYTEQADRITTEFVREVLRYVYDPELNVNIVDLGLVYGIDISPDNRVVVQMTFTSPGCPYGPVLIYEVRKTLEQIKGVTDVDIDIVWTPPWSEEQMSEDARLELGFDL